MTDDIAAKLAAPFPPDIVSWRVGSTNKDKNRGMALAYIDARDVMNRLDEVCGLYWQSRHPWAAEKKLACEIGIKIDGEWVWRGDGGGDTDYEAEKGAFSESFKRAAVHWGIGRYLYDVDAPWVEIEAFGRSFKIADKEIVRLRARLPGGPARSQHHQPTADRSDAPQQAAARPQQRQPAPARPNGAPPERTPAEATRALWRAISEAKTPKLIEDIIATNTGDLLRIKTANATAYERLVAHATARRVEMLASA